MAPGCWPPDQTTGPPGRHANRPNRPATRRHPDRRTRNATGTGQNSQTAAPRPQRTTTVIHTGAGAETTARAATSEVTLPHIRRRCAGRRSGAPPSDRPRIAAAAVATATTPSSHRTACGSVEPDVTRTTAVSATTQTEATYARPGRAVQSCRLPAASTAAASRRPAPPDAMCAVRTTVRRPPSMTSTSRDSAPRGCLMDHSRRASTPRRRPAALSSASIQPRYGRLLRLAGRRLDAARIHGDPSDTP